jgi:DNA helicase-2/ATP-dependent DNA helicase PcrA
VARILAAWRAAGIAWSEMAVILRVNHLSRQLEIALREAGIPYAMISGLEFFERREVKDVLAYARLLENPRDDAAFLRVVNEPRRGVGAGTLEKVRALAMERGISIPEAAASAVEGVRGRAREGLDRFLAALARLRARPRAPVAPLLEAIAEETGYLAELLAREDDVDRARAENLEELVVAARQFDAEHPDLALADFLQRTALVSDQDGLDARAGLVTLMTCHAAKGLEFEGLVVLGVEEGFFPHARSLEKPEDLEEERRLFYVAMTRARRRLVFTHVGQRDVFRGLERREPSRFLLREIPDEILDVRDDAGLYLRQRARAESSLEAEASPPSPWSVREGGSGAPRGRGSGGPGRRGAGNWGRGADAFEAETQPEGDEVVFSQVAPDLPRVGERVAHPYFGPGRLVATSGAGASLRVTVDFEAAGTKTIRWTPDLLERLSEPEGQA